ncbi:MAG: hypothetical protein RLP44_21960 [Aggregatilineales bacterium]
MTKAEIEQSIVQAWYSVKWSNRDFDWLTSEEFLTFLRVFGKLHSYYRAHRDEPDETETIYFEVLRVYFHVERLLYQILRNPKLSQYHDIVSDKISDIEYSMDNLIGINYERMQLEEDESEE